MGTVEGPDQTSSKPCIDICLSSTVLIRVSNARISTQHINAASAQSILVTGDDTCLVYYTI